MSWRPKPYLKHPEIPIENAKKIFKWRTHMVDVKHNFKNAFQQNDLFCPLCSTSNEDEKYEDTQEHIAICSKIDEILKHHLTVKQNIDYNLIFADKFDNIERLNVTIEYLEKRLQARKSIVQLFIRE